MDAEKGLRGMVRIGIYALLNGIETLKERGADAPRD